MIMNLAVPRLERTEQRGFLTKQLLLTRSPGCLKMPVNDSGMWDGDSRWGAVSHSLAECLLQHKLGKC